MKTRSPGKPSRPDLHVLVVNITSETVIRHVFSKATVTLSGAGFHQTHGPPLAIKRNQKQKATLGQAETIPSSS
jgi:hypothetical protein